jgi:glucose 1-dehydrogenase
VDIRDDEKPTEVARRIEALGRRALVYTADVCDRLAIEDMVEMGIEKFGRIDCLVNNAAISIPAPVLEMTEEAWDRNIDVVLKSAFICTQAVARYWSETGRGGKVVIIGSIHGTRSFERFTNYAAAKSGLKGLTRNLALELAPLNITVNLVSPGVIDTGTHDRGPDIDERVAREVPLRRMGECSEVANLVAFLVGNESDYITGTEIVIDGGLLLYPFSV